MSPSPAEVKLQLERVLASTFFTGSGRMSRFLAFIVDKALAGEADRLKEYVIGVEVFDRDEHYDPRVDSIVRVEAARLRSKLAEYYAGEGRDDAVVLSLPKGGYAPVATLAPAPVATIESAALPAVAPAAALPAPAPMTRRRWWSVGALAALAIALAVFAIRTPSNAVDTTVLRVAVLPFTPYTQVEAERVLAARITDGVTAELVRLGTFDVVASSTAREIGARAARARDVATALDADVLVEARIVTTDARVVVEARAVDGLGEGKFWVGEVTGSADDLAGLARDVARAVASAVGAADVRRAAQ